MQLTTTAIKHKRYSTYGWNFTENGIYKNTLAQGEIGILLGHKQSKVVNGEEIIVVEPIEIANSGKTLDGIIEVRIGTEDNQYFFNALILSKNGDIDYSIRQVSSLPSFGNPNCLYILTTTNIAYRWDDETLRMVPLQGTGNNQDVNLSNYYTKDEIDDLITFEMIDGGNCICNPSLHK